MLRSERSKNTAVSGMAGEGLPGGGGISSLMFRILIGRENEMMGLLRNGGGFGTLVLGLQEEF